MLTLALVLLLHGLAFLWFAGYRAPANPSQDDNTPVQVELLKPQPIARAPEAPPAPRPEPRANTKTQPAGQPALTPTPARTRTPPVVTPTAPDSTTTAPRYYLHSSTIEDLAS